MATTRTTEARAQRRIRQLCCLGLRSESIMPSLLGELHSLIPAYGNTFYWVDAHGTLRNAYDEHPEFVKIGPLYTSDFYNRRELEVHPGFSAVVRSFSGVVTHDEFFSVTRRQLERSSFYNLVMRPQRYHTVLQLYLREAGRPLGVLQLQRSRGVRDFTDAEAQRLARLAPFLAHALATHPAAEETETVENDESGLVIADHRGRLLGTSAQGRRLLYLATHPRLQPPGRDGLSSRLPPPVVEICSNAVAIAGDDAAVPPPVVRLRNPWGVFVFRAYAVERGNGVPRQIGITVTREVPLMLRLTHGAHRLGLSRRQSEIAVLLGSGKSHRQIAEQLGISRHTVISHSRWIHAKLGVHETPALREALLEGAGSA